MVPVSLECSHSGMSVSRENLCSVFPANGLLNFVLVVERTTESKGATLLHTNRKLSSHRGQRMYSQALLCFADSLPRSNFVLIPVTSDENLDQCSWPGAKYHFI